MITLKESGNSTFILANVTDFTDSMGYCEHKIPLLMQGIKPLPSLETVKGSEAHKKEEDFEKEHFVFVPISKAELDDMTKDVEFAREKIFTRLPYAMTVGGKAVNLLLFGRADKVMRSKETLIVQDDKFPTNLRKYETRFEPYDDQKLQALVYLNSKFADEGSLDPKDWFDISHKEKAWVIQIRDRNNGNAPFKIFKGMQNKEAADYLTESLERFALLVLGREERMHHGMPDKCRPCRLFDMCEFKLS